MIQQRKKRNSSKINLTISFVFHSILVLAIFYFAAKEGLLGKKLKQIAVTMIKEKKPDPPKPKQEEPKPEPPKTEAPKAAIPPPKAVVSAPPPASTAPAVAPAAAVLPDIVFDGGKDVQSITDANGIYKALVEHTLRSRWNRPEDMADDSFVAEVEFTISKTGEVEGSRWISGSGDARWDKSVKDALAQFKSVSRPPPKGFPGTFRVRFDVESQKTEAIQFSTQ